MARPRGAVNRVGAQVKENVLAVFTRIGGTHAMARWARKNRTEFYRLYARLMPTEVTGTIDLRNATELSESELIAIATGSGQRAIEPPAGQAEIPEVH